MTGAEVIAEMITELFSSAEQGAQFEGEMQRLASYARCVRARAPCLILSHCCLGRSAEGGPCTCALTRQPNVSRALATALSCVRSAAGGRPVELLRKESLAGLLPAAAAKVLTHAYLAVVPITSLPYPPLPLSPSRPGGCDDQQAACLCACMSIGSRLLSLLCHWKSSHCLPTTRA